MAYGSVAVDTLNTSTGVFQTNNAYLGVAKAWLQYNGSTQTIITSFNVSSVTRTGTGVYQINFSTAMSSANFVTLVGSHDVTTNNAVANNILIPTSASYTTVSHYENGATLVDTDGMFVAVFSN